MWSHTLKMYSPNNTSVREAQFVVLCFPGDWRWWKGLLCAVFLLLFLAALFANLSLLLVIWTEHRLHIPMYYFVCYLSLLDLALCLIVVPIVLAGLLFALRVINASTCFLQIYFINSLAATQSGVLTVMAYDRYVAICKPLQYPLIITNNNVIKAIGAMSVKSWVLVMPTVILPAQLDYCNGNVIENCYCNSLEVSILACDSNPIIEIYHVAIMFFTTFLEMLFIAFSYFMIIHAVFRLPSKNASTKVFNTCGSHFIVISYFYSSVIIIVVTNMHGDKIPSDIRTLLTILFCTIPPVINPLVYGLRTKGFMQSILNRLKTCK